jgi:hypothetical protein
MRETPGPVLIDDDDDLPWQQEQPMRRSEQRRTAKGARHRRPWKLKALALLTALAAAAAGALYLTGFDFGKAASDLKMPKFVTDVVDKVKGTDTSETAVVEAAPGPEVVPAPVIPTSVMGAPVREGDFLFVVTGINYQTRTVPAPDPAAPPLPAGGTAAVNLLVENLGPTAILFDPALQAMIDNRGGVFFPVSVLQAGDLPEAPTPLPPTIEPGGRLLLVLNYDLPEGSYPAIVEVNDFPPVPGTQIKMVP